MITNCIFILIIFSTCAVSLNSPAPGFERILIESRIPGLKLALLHLKCKGKSGKPPVLFIHGSSFPSALAAGFRMDGFSWMDDLARDGYDVYALDFLGYGASDRYPEMFEQAENNKPPGRASEIYQDIDKAVSYLIKKSNYTKVNLIAHSWGATIAALYVQKFPQNIEKLVLFAPITAGKSKNNNYEKINIAYECMSPAERIKSMKELTPVNEECRLEEDIYVNWGNEWLKSAAPFQKGKNDVVCFPSGWRTDINDLENGHSYYNPDSIYCPVLLIRGEWDTSPSWEDAEDLFKSLINTKQKRYVVIEKGTHVMHLEKSRFQLYTETRSFLDDSY